MSNKSAIVDLGGLEGRHVQGPYPTYRGKARIGTQCLYCNRTWPCDAAILAQQLRENGLERLRIDLEDLRDSGYQPSYNGRPSCPFCLNFIDQEETHSDDCPLVAALGVEGSDR